MKFIKYIHRYYYNISINLNGKKPSDSANLYVSSVLLLSIIPLLSGLILYFIDKKYKIQFFCLLSLCTFILYKLISKFILSKIHFLEIEYNIKKEKLIQKIAGYSVAISLVFIAPLFGFWILSLWHR